MRIPTKYLESVVRNLKYNDTILNYYDRLWMDRLADKVVELKVDRMYECNKFWTLAKYEKSKVKDFIKTSLCKDKFCNNCKKVKQASRMAKFMPEIKKFRDDPNNKIYQIVLTMPNVKGEQLGEAIDKLFKSMATLIEYLKVKKKIRGLDFEWVGYKAAIRSLEVTYKNDEYHPHLHVLIVCTGDIGKKEHLNKFSYDKYKKRVKRKFSDFEILLQKIWFLLINNIKVTKKAIDDLELGYSCMMDEFKDDDFIELFKYMTKGDGKEEGSDKSELMTYEQFKTLYVQLRSVRQIQGYGELFRLKDEDISDQVNEKYEQIVNDLLKKEVPVNVYETPQELLKDTEYLLISKKRIYEEIRKLDQS